MTKLIQAEIAQHKISKSDISLLYRKLQPKSSCAKIMITAIVEIRAFMPHAKKKTVLQIKMIK